MTMVEVSDGAQFGLQEAKSLIQFRKERVLIRIRFDKEYVGFMHIKITMGT